MPYCPKCDMEFIDGITVCSDCGGPLEESKEAALAKKRQEQEKALALKQAEYEEQQKEYEAWQAAIAETQEGPAAGQEPPKSTHRPEPSHVYVKKSQKYDDLKSSASAFFFVGGALLVFSLLCWIGILKLPVGVPALCIITAMALAALAVAAKTVKSAKEVQGQISAEEDGIRQAIGWFLGNYTAARLDAQLREEYQEPLSPEEFSLKRYGLIQDILITNHDFTDLSYVELLAEEIYPQLYKD